MGFNLKHMVKVCDDDALGKVKRVESAKRPLSTPKYWKKGCSSLSAHFKLTLLEIRIIGCWSWRTPLIMNQLFFFKDKSELKEVMLGLMEDLKIWYGINVKWARH